VIALIAAAAFLRVPDLSLRPFHGDEAVNTVKFNQLWTGQGYRYDPHEYHGPTLIYLTRLLLPLTGAADFNDTSEASFRIVTVIFGVILVGLTVMFRRAMGLPAALLAGALVAASPAFVFYSRYYIHEMLLVVFTAGAMLAGHAYLQSRWPTAALVCGTMLGLMHATKETGALAGFAMLLALIITALLAPRASSQTPATPVPSSQSPQSPASSSQSPGTPVPGAFQTRLARALPPMSHLLLGLAGFLLVVIVLFSSFFTNWPGIADSVLTYLTWFKLGTEGNEGKHLYPWYHYFSLLGWNEAGRLVFTELAILALAAVGFIFALIGRPIAPAHRSFARFIALYSLILTALYCLIPYKTPWLMLGFLHGYILLAALAAWSIAAALARLHLLVGSIALLLVLSAAVHLAYQSHQINTVFYVHRFNPYAYSQPGLDVRRIGERAGQIAAVSPDGPDMPILVIFADNYWPLPYYLRSMRRVGYFDRLPDRLDQPAMIIAHPNLGDRIDEMIAADYQHEHYGLRRYVPLEVRIRRDLWTAFMSTRQR
jgi:uncharacterized protein (TIGR03663 family)